MRVLVVSTYELGRQPLAAASAAAALRAAGHDVRGLDLAVEPWDDERVRWAEAVALSIPMHTAMRLAVVAARRLRAERPDLPIAAFGLYGPVAHDHVVDGLVDIALAGEHEPLLVRWVDGLAEASGGRLAAAGGGPVPVPVPVHLTVDRQPSLLPARDAFPPLDRYARLDISGDLRLVGAVEAARGCAHRCLHCPVPAVYGGRVRRGEVDVVLADVEALVRLGAEHLTFADPDLLSAPAHASRVVDAVHSAFPHLTFDATVKVEHILRHEGLWPRWAEQGCLFVVSAIESVDDVVLDRLRKGHSAADAGRAVHVLRDAGIDLHPSFLPFTPWTTLGSLVDLLDFAEVHSLAGLVDPVQWSIRLLLPPGSLLLEEPDVQELLGPYDAEGLTWTWSSPDPRVDLLQADLAALAARLSAEGADAAAAFAEVEARVRAAAGVALREAVPAGATEGRPRLTEPWFC